MISSAPLFLSRLIETIVPSDWAAELPALEEGIKPKRYTDYANLSSHLEESEFNARLTHRCFTAVMLEQESWLRKNQAAIAEMRDRARKWLELDKAAKDLTKMITDADVVSQMSVMFPEEYDRMERIKAEFKAAKESLEHLVKIYSTHCHSVQTRLAKARH